MISVENQYGGSSKNYELGVLKKRKKKSNLNRMIQQFQFWVCTQKN